MITQKANEIKPFIVMEVLEKAAEMERQGNQCDSSRSGGARF
jgi:hypothetical protein